MANRKIIITDNLKFLKKGLCGTEESTSWLVIEYDDKSNRLRNYLLSLPSACEVISKNVLNEEIFVRNYSDFIYNLNKKNVSRAWWALNFTNKNPILTTLCKNIYDFLIVKKLLEAKPDDNIAIVLSSRHLARFIKDRMKLKRISADIMVSHKLNLKHLVSYVPIFSIFYNFLRLSLRMFLSKALFKTENLSKKDCIIITQFENHSFKNGKNFRDVYFGRLNQLLKKEDKKFIMCGFSFCAFRNIIMRRSELRNNSAYPLEYFLSLTNLFKCLKESIRACRKRHLIRGNTKIDGEDVQELVENEIDNAFGAGQPFINLCVYYSVKALLAKIWTERIIYPFENRSWEKMILLAAREAKKNIRLLGYQHASLTPKHINFIIEKEELSNTPFPDGVVAMGKITKILMEDIFKFPKYFVKVGCALRQELVFSGKKHDKNRKEAFELFVVLAANLDEYVKTLRFLDKASLGADYLIKIRPHPITDFNKALVIYKPRNFNYVLEGSETALYDSLKSSDIVLYASSTAGIEALSIGKPLVYIDFGDFINPDPLFNFSDFKWKCENPDDLVKVLGEIRSLDEVSLKEKQRKGMLYAREYFYPVNSENIKAFL